MRPSLQARRCVGCLALPQVLAPSLAWLEVENCYRLRLPAELSRLQSLQRLGVNHQRLEEVGGAGIVMQ